MYLNLSFMFLFLGGGLGKRRRSIYFVRACSHDTHTFSLCVFVSHVCLFAYVYTCIYRNDTSIKVTCIDWAYVENPSRHSPDLVWLGDLHKQREANSFVLVRRHLLKPTRAARTPVSIGIRGKPFQDIVLIWSGACTTRG